MDDTDDGLDDTPTPGQRETFEEWIKKHDPATAQWIAENPERWAEIEEEGRIQREKSDAYYREHPEEYERMMSISSDNAFDDNAFDEFKKLVRNLPPQELSLIDVADTGKIFEEEDRAKFILTFLVAKIQAGKTLTKQEEGLFRYMEWSNAEVQEFKNLALRERDPNNPTRLLEMFEQVHARIEVVRHVGKNGIPEDLPPEEQALIKELLKNPLAGLLPQETGLLDAYSKLPKHRKQSIKDTVKNVALGIAGLFGYQDHADRVQAMFKKSPLTTKANALERLKREFEQSKKEHPELEKSLKQIYEEEKRKILES